MGKWLVVMSIFSKKSKTVNSIKHWLQLLFIIKFYKVPTSELISVNDRALFQVQSQQFSLATKQPVFFCDMVMEDLTPESRENFLSVLAGQTSRAAESKQTEWDSVLSVSFSKPFWNEQSLCV